LTANGPHSLANERVSPCRPAFAAA
jgi:hypothetical protein